MLAVSGSDFVIVAGDTRVSTGYSINTRHGSKLTELYEARIGCLVFFANFARALLVLCCGCVLEIEC